MIPVSEIENRMRTREATYEDDTAVTKRIGSLERDCCDCCTPETDGKLAESLSSESKTRTFST
jgi:hypothetical protein